MTGRTAAYRPGLAVGALALDRSGVKQRFTDPRSVAQQEVGYVKAETEGEEEAERTAADGDRLARDHSRAFAEQVLQPVLRLAHVGPAALVDHVLDGRRQHAVDLVCPRGEVDGVVLQRRNHCKRLLDDERADPQGGEDHGEKDDRQRDDGGRIAPPAPRHQHPFVERLEHDRGESGPEQRGGERPRDPDQHEGDSREDQEEAYLLDLGRVVLFTGHDVGVFIGQWVCLFLPRFPLRVPEHHEYSARASVSCDTQVPIRRRDSRRSGHYPG